MLPEHLVELLTFVLRDIKRVALVEVEAKTAEAPLAVREQLGVERLELVLLLDTEISLAHRDGKIGCAFHASDRVEIAEWYSLR